MSALLLSVEEVPVPTRLDKSTQTALSFLSQGALVSSQTASSSPVSEFRRQVRPRLDHRAESEGTAVESAIVRGVTDDNLLLRIRGSPDESLSPSSSSS